MTGNPLERIKVSANHHFLATASGRPFFWLADTAWSLFHRLKREEIIDYFANRQAKGFNVIQIVMLAEQDGLNSPNPYGEYPLLNNDPNTPNPAYFERLDDYLELAAQFGLYICLLPTWADKVTPHWGTGPQVFNEQNAQAYGRWLAERYREMTNIIWCLGGDRPITKGENDWRPIWRAMAQGIRAVLGENALITYHPDGGLDTPAAVHAENWSDLILIQSGHWQRESPGWEWIEALYQMTPTKPALDGEPNYEDHPVAPWPTWDPHTGYFRDYEVRKQTYRTVFAGGAGVTYGHHSIWQCASEQAEWINHAERTWRKALDRPGASQMIHLRHLIESRPCLERIPDQSLLAAAAQGRAEHPRAFRDAGGRYAMFYLPGFQSFLVNTAQKIKCARIRAWWYNPRTGAAAQVGEFSNQDGLSFTTPNDGPDWVLVLEEASCGWAAPGAISSSMSA